jgi:hypothetical protein
VSCLYCWWCLVNAGNGVYFLFRLWCWSLLYPYLHGVGVSFILSILVLASPISSATGACVMLWPHYSGASVSIILSKLLHLPYSDAIVCCIFSILALVSCIAPLFWCYSLRVVVEVSPAVVWCWYLHITEYKPAHLFYGAVR